MNTTEALKTLYLELDWLEKVINQVIKSYLVQEGHERHWQDIPMPNLEARVDPYSVTVNLWQLNRFERLALVLAMAPYLKPEILDVFFGRHQLYDRRFTEFGGVVDKNYSGFIPTGQTFLFLVSATNPELRYEAMQVLHGNTKLFKERVMSLTTTKAHLPKSSGVLKLSEGWFNYFLTGETLQIEKEFDIQVQKMSTYLDWSDLVIGADSMAQIAEIAAWLDYEDTLMKDWELSRKLQSGFRVLFYGPQGTGKTQVAALLGKASHRDVYRIDLSTLVSKSIGETEKNLAKLLDRAEYNHWILFFDEADAIFSKRTAVDTFGDRYANQEISYLLQRIENFSGVIIVATNQEVSIDSNVMRRFQSTVQFSIPNSKERYQIWQNTFSGKCQLDSSIDVMKIAEDYELSGGQIVNILRYCALVCIQRQTTVVTQKDLIEGIRKEYKKENRTIG